MFERGCHNEAAASVAAAADAVEKWWHLNANKNLQLDNILESMFQIMDVIPC